MKSTNCFKCLSFVALRKITGCLVIGANLKIQGSFDFVVSFTSKKSQTWSGCHSALESMPQLPPWAHSVYIRVKFGILIKILTDLSNPLPILTLLFHSLFFDVGDHLQSQIWKTACYFKPVSLADHNTITDMKYCLLCCSFNNFKPVSLHLAFFTDEGYVTKVVILT